LAICTLSAAIVWYFMLLLLVELAINSNASMKTTITPDNINAIDLFFISIFAMFNSPISPLCALSL
jgi:hypothetical protein